MKELRNLQAQGVGDDLMIGYIKSKGRTYDLSAEQLIRLKDGGVDDAVIKTLMAAPPASSGQQERAGVSTVTPLTSRTVAPVQAESPLPDEIGVYVKRREEWVEVLPEVVNWKTGGAVKTLATAGWVKEDVNGHIRGSSSRTLCNKSSQFLVITPEGTAITEYLLLKLRTNNDNREFRTFTGGVFHASGGASRDLASFEGKKITRRTYAVTLGNLEPGEYGFLPPGAYATANLGSSGKIHTFRVTE